MRATCAPVLAGKLLQRKRLKTAADADARHSSRPEVLRRARLTQTLNNREHTPTPESYSLTMIPARQRYAKIPRVVTYHKDGPVVRGQEHVGGFDVAVGPGRLVVVHLTQPKAYSRKNL